MKKINLFTKTTSLLTAVILLFSGCSKTVNSDTSDVQKNTEAAKSDKLITVNIGFPSSGSDWPGATLGAAEEYGYLDEFLNPLGYDVKLTGFVGAAPAIHEALVSKDLDYACYAGFAGVLSKSNGIDTKLLAVTSYGSNWQLAVNTSSGINSIEDLKGKKIAYQRGATPQMYILKVLAEAGLTENDVELLNCTIPEGISSLSTNAIDAAVVSYGTVNELVNAGTAKVIHAGVESDHSIYFEPTVLIGRTDFVADHEEFNVALIEALLKAKDKIKEDRNAYYQLQSDKSGVPLELVLGVAIDDLDVSFPISLDEQYINSLKNIQEFELSNGLIQNNFDIDEWTDRTYLDKAYAK